MLLPSEQLVVGVQTPNRLVVSAVLSSGTSSNMSTQSPRQHKSSVEGLGLWCRLSRSARHIPNYAGNQHDTTWDSKATTHFEGNLQSWKQNRLLPEQRFALARTHCSAALQLGLLHHQRLLQCHPQPLGRPAQTDQRFSEPGQQHQKPLHKILTAQYIEVYTEGSHLHIC